MALIGKEAKELISLYDIPKRKVLIFDDLERLEAKTINEVLGFINTYTEHDNLKVIIVAYEKELIKKFKGPQTDYEQVKEKLIRFTYKFEID